MDVRFVIGMTEAIAYTTLQEFGFNVRVTKRDDKHFLVTCDWCADRANIVVRDNIVIDVNIG